MDTNRRGDTHTEKMQCEDKGRTWSDMAKSSGISSDIRSWKRQEMNSPLESMEEAWLC